MPWDFLSRINAVLSPFVDFRRLKLRPPFIRSDPKEISTSCLTLLPLALPACENMDYIGHPLSLARSKATSWRTLLFGKGWKNNPQQHTITQGKTKSRVVLRPYRRLLEILGPWYWGVNLEQSLLRQHARQTKRVHHCRGAGLGKVMVGQRKHVSFFWQFTTNFPLANQSLPRDDSFAPQR